MTDIIPNIIVSMPNQLFTMSRTFKSVSNGSIYIGKPDTDPTNPDNQVDVYFENENGKYIKVSQPIKISQA
ncbi:phage tailspike protein, partial [Escherichia coli]